MSRKNAKCAQITDLQCKHGTIILTRRDCIMIARALYKCNNFEDISVLYYFLLSVIEK